MSWCRCCCVRGSKEDEADGGLVAETEYLLPGGEWDPQSSRSSRAASGGRGGYVPPAVQPSSGLPVVQDFQLLKTLGKGAFGKVTLRAATPTLLPCIYRLVVHVHVSRVAAFAVNFSSYDTEYTHQLFGKPSVFC